MSGFRQNVRSQTTCQESDKMPGVRQHHRSQTTCQESYNMSGVRQHVRVGMKCQDMDGYLDIRRNLQDKISGFLQNFRNRTTHWTVQELNYQPCNSHLTILNNNSTNISVTVLIFQYCPIYYNITLPILKQSPYNINKTIVPIVALQF